MAAVDYFLKIDGIQGESKAVQHKNEIDIESFSWGAMQSGTFAAGGGGGAGKVSMQDFHFTMGVNKASPTLFLTCARGDHVKDAILTCRKAGKKQQEFMKVTMSDCLVSSFQTDGHGGGNVTPTDQISLNFAKIEVEYKEHDATGKLIGSTKMWFDLKSVTGSSSP
jgi:type VI secretion system secreted protein Hcp